MPTWVHAAIVLAAVSKRKTATLSSSFSPPLFFLSSSCAFFISFSFSCVQVRLVYYAVDPHGIQGFLPDFAMRVLFEMSVIIWLACGFGITLYWYLHYLSPFSLVLNSV